MTPIAISPSAIAEKQKKVIVRMNNKSTKFESPGCRISFPWFLLKALNMFIVSKLISPTFSYHMVSTFRLLCYEYVPYCLCSFWSMTSKTRQRILWMAAEMNIARFHSFSVTVTNTCVHARACVCVFIRLIIQNEQSASLAHPYTAVAMLK